MENEIPIEFGRGQIYGNESMGFTVAYRGQWICGIYDSLDAAKAAINWVWQGWEEALYRRWSTKQAGANGKRVISLAELMRWTRMELML